MALHNRHFSGFGDVMFKKKGSEIIEKSRAQIEALATHLGVRETRVHDFFKMKLGIDPQPIVARLRAGQFDDGTSSLLVGASYSTDKVNVTAGDVENIKTEIRLYNDELEALNKHKRLVRNLDADTVFDLSLSDLEAFDF